MPTCAYGSEWDGVGSDWYAWTDYDLQLYLDWAGLGAIKYLVSALTLPQLFQLSNFCTTERTYQGDLSLVDLGGVVQVDVSGRPSINPLPGVDAIGKLNANATWYLWATHCLCSAPPVTCLSLCNVPPLTPNQTSGAAQVVGVRFTALAAGEIKVRYFTPIGTGPFGATFRLWDWATGTLIASTGVVTSTSNQVVDAAFAGAPQAVAGHDYIIGYQVVTSALFTYFTPNTNTLSNANMSGVQSYTRAGTSSLYPSTPVGSGTFGCSPVVCASGGSPTTPTLPTPAVIPSVQMAAAPACASYSDICDRLHALEQQVIWTKGSVDLVQRQSAPFAYTLGVSHSVTGDGSFAVQGILGLSVDLTVIPSRIGWAPGTPDAYFRLGWVSLGTAQGWERPVPLRTDPTLILGVSGAITKVGYSLPSGAAATITELLTEY